jgi:hypothetical protein
LPENEVIDLCLGEEKNVFQTDDLGDETDEIEEMYF